MTIDSVKDPDDEFLSAMIEEYKEFDKNQVSNKMATLVFAELRNSAKVNLQNLTIYQTDWDLIGIRCKIESTVYKLPQVPFTKAKNLRSS